MNAYADVVFPLPILRTFSYGLPAKLRERARVGARVSAPFGRRELTGFIVRLRAGRPVGPETLKDISDIIDESPPFSPRFLAFTRKLAAYHHSSWGEILQAALPPSAGTEARVLVSLTAAGREALAGPDLARPERELAAVLGAKAYTKTYLRRRVGPAGFAPLLARLEKKGLIELVEAKPGPKRARAKSAGPSSSPARQLPLDFSYGREAAAAAAAIRARRTERSFSLSYLFADANVREAVYLELLRDVLAGGGRALILVPEISPGLALGERLERNLGERAAVLHSRLTDRQKDEAWGRIRSGRAPVVIGPRSALFAPLTRLGLLVCDDEQDESFGQAESPAFDARQGIVARARVEKSAAVLGSSAPSVGWFHRAETEGFLVAARTGPASPGAARVVDMTGERRPLSAALEEGIRSRLARKERVIIYLNRRGYTSALVCPRCGHVPRCPDCDISLTYYKRENKLACRYCRFSAEAPLRCPRCGEAYRGGREWGIEALEEEVRRRFPSARVACFDSDATARSSDRARVLREAGEGRVDIVLGTGLLAHQAEVPSVGLAAILAPEALLSLADYRAGQKTFQTIVRMRAAARTKEGATAPVIIQTALPEHHSIRAAAAGDFRAFFREEITFRRLMGYPPFSWMVEVLFQGREARALGGQVRAFVENVRAAAPEVEVLGQARAPVSRVRGQARMQVLLRAKKKERLDAALEEALSRTAAVRGVRLFD